MVEIATSESHPIYVAWLWTGEDTDKPGALGLTIAPGKQGPGAFAMWKRNLPADLARLKELGVTMLAPLLTDGELERLRVRDYESAAAKAGMRVLRFPFHDGGVPKGLASLDLFLDSLVGLLAAGEHVVVHCRGGLGRAGLVGACLLMKLGICSTAADAIAMVRARRSRKAIETREQELFVVSFAEHLAAAGQAHGDS